MLIPILHAEKQLQLFDLTRFDASKSVLVKGSANPINSVKIKAGADAAYIEVYNSVQKNWFLDFAFNSYAFDVDSSNDDITFEIGSTQYSTNVAAGTYSLANLLQAVKTAMEAVASPLTVSFTVDERNRVTLNPSLPLNVLPNFTSADLFHHIGFKDEGQIIGYPVEYGIRKITLTVASSSESASFSHYLEVYTPEGDALFSDDSDFTVNENDIMKWLPNGRGSFLDLHRKAQKEIVDWCDRKGYRDDLGKKITKWAFVDNSDVRMWSAYMGLRMFFEGVQNQTDDVFKKKADMYGKKEIEARNRVELSLDLNGDKKADTASAVSFSSGRLIMR